VVAGAFDGPFVEFSVSDDAIVGALAAGLAGFFGSIAGSEESQARASALRISVRPFALTARSWPEATCSNVNVRPTSAHSQNSAIENAPSSMILLRSRPHDCGNYGARMDVDEREYELL
jgi:hypothetical protein